MTDANDTGLMTVKEVAQATGIPASTIRYYDQQFEEFLDIRRGAGRRRLFSPRSVDRLLEVRRLLKDEGLNLRQARQKLAEGGGGPAPEPQAAARPAVDPEELEALKQRMKILEDKLEQLREIQATTLNLVGSLKR